MDYFREIKPTYWLSVVRENGVLEIYSISGDVLLERFRTTHVHQGHRLLVNSKLDHMSPLPAVKCGIVEMGIFGLGHLNRRPVLMLRTTDFSVLLYEIIPTVESLESELTIRLRKLNHNLLLRETKT